MYTKCCINIKSSCLACKGSLRCSGFHGYWKSTLSKFYCTRINAYFVLITSDQQCKFTPNTVVGWWNELEDLSCRRFVSGWSSALDFGVLNERIILAHCNLLLFFPLTMLSSFFCQNSLNLCFLIDPIWDTALNHRMCLVRGQSSTIFYGAQLKFLMLPRFLSVMTNSKVKHKNFGTNRVKCV